MVKRPITPSGQKAYLKPLLVVGAHLARAGVAKEDELGAVEPGARLLYRHVDRLRKGRSRRAPALVPHRRNRRKGLPARPSPTPRLLTPLTTVILDIAARELPDASPSRALALARAFERVGGIAGAVLAAVLSATLGYRSATALLGIIVLTLGLGTVSLLRPVRSREFAHG